MILSKLTSCNKINIRAPRWKERTVGIASYCIGTHNEIDIAYKNRAGEKLYPSPLYASASLIKSCPTQKLSSGVLLYLVPISSLETLERSST
ncbi:hypothetical protein UFOVP585_9 [uncultured Caudovirales phage]|uniref:Uncharacterized protein n=1 Tax=uncultured Caudovirales phage TaxID=2100421 RepID=A0A6J5N1W3_9CAUD|nr:hypothetical protein UFOVP585_9 [uncultured Caudovirales phage]